MNACNLWHMHRTLAWTADPLSTESMRPVLSQLLVDPYDAVRDAAGSLRAVLVLASLGSRARRDGAS